MQEQRPHEQRIAGCRDAEHFGGLGAQFLNPFCGKPTKPMRTRQYFQRAIGFIGRIEVQPDREHPGEQFHRWLHMGDAFFQRPRTEAQYVDLLLQSDREILMPGHQPVGLG